MELRWRRIYLTVLGLAAALAPALAQAADAVQQAEKATDSQEAEKTKFVRLLRDAAGEMIALETAIVRYVPIDGKNPGLVVDLVAAVHVGEKSYYHQLNREFKQYDALLYELVAPAGTKIPKGGKPSGSAVGALQGGMQDMLGLEHQLEQINYQKKNFVHADMSPSDFAKSMEDRGETFLSMFFRMMGAGLVEQNRKKNQGANASLMMALFSNDRELALRQYLAQQMEDVEGQMSALEGPGGSTLIAGRNEVAFKVLAEQIEAGKKKIGVFYGAGHLADMDRRLTEEFGLRRAEERWLPALGSAGQKKQEGHQVKFTWQPS